MLCIVMVHSVWICKEDIYTCTHLYMYVYRCLYIFYTRIVTDISHFQFRNWVLMCEG